MFCKSLRALTATAAFFAASAVHAFMPAPGLWGMSAELNGAPGRGFQIEVENEIVVLSYYGYRADGSSVFYSAVGPISDNRFLAPLIEYRGGTALGTGFRNGVEASSPGNVTLDFRTGKSGTITLPNESPKPVVKFGFGYAPTPEGLYGTYLFSYVTPSFIISDFYSIVRTLNSRTANGSGLAVNGSGNFACENQVQGSLTGMILCVEANDSQNDDYYFFRMSGDRGAGVGTWKAVSQTSAYPLFVTRTHSRSGRATGINDSNDATLSLQRAAEASNAAALQQADDMKKQSGAVAPANEAALSPEEAQAFARWRQDAQWLLRQR